MPRYLLSTRTLLALATGRDSPERRWMDGAAAKGVVNSDIYYSAVAPMRLNRDLDDRIAAARSGQPLLDGDNVPDLQLVRSNAARLFANYQPIPVSVEIADMWGSLLDTRMEYSRLKPDRSVELEAFSSSEKLEMATAIVGEHGISLTYVDQVAPGHDLITGLRVENPAHLYGKP